MLRWLTAGESHGPALVGIIEGVPAGVELSSPRIVEALARRRLGYGRGARMKFEQDEVRILGGVRHGITQGGPVAIEVANTGDRPIQVGSHYHFFEANAGLRFDRALTRGMRLDIAAGTAVRFEPGQTREVRLVPLSGDRIVYGFRQQIMGSL